MAHSTRGNGADPQAGDDPATAPNADRAATTHDLAGALHEVSNALTVILGWIERAREARGDELTRALDIASSRARAARTIVRRAIGDTGTSIDNGAISSRSIGEIVREAVTALDPESLRAGVRLGAEIDPGAAAHRVHDDDAVTQILTNLLLNAIAMSPRGGAVHVDVAELADAVVVGVSDEGPGIPAERRATLFTDGVSTRAGGAGIGLRHSAALAASAGGALSIAPSRRGARFELRWPIASFPARGHAPPRPAGQSPRGFGGAARLDRAEPPSSTAPHSPRSARDDQRAVPPGHMAVQTEAATSSRPSTSGAAAGAVLDGIRILLVEDDEAVVDLLDTALSARGAIIVSVRDVVDLPRALASGPFHAALLDISPIQEDIPGTVTAVRDKSPDARLVVMSGSAHVPELQGERGAAWVRKPFEVREIVDALIG